MPFEIKELGKGFNIHFDGATVVINSKTIAATSPKGYKEEGFIKKSVKFLNEFYEKFKSIDMIREIITDLNNTKTWRMWGNNIRRNANILCTSKNLMSNADFQAKWFYEGTMEGRTTHGANAPWIGNIKIPIGSAPRQTREKAAKNMAIKSTTSELPENTQKYSKSKKKDFKPFEWDMSREWDRKNRPVFEALGIEIEK